MRKTFRTVALSIFVNVLFAVGAHAAGAHSHIANNMALAKQNYVLDCMGCHSAKGVVDPGRIPPLANNAAWYLGVRGGREFLARVPGSSSSNLTDAQLAGVLNYILIKMNGSLLSKSFQPYTAAEVKKYRRPEYANPAVHRNVLIDELRAQGNPHVKRYY